MAFETEKFTSRKFKLENLLLLMEEREKTLKSLISELTVRLQARELDEDIKVKDNMLRHFTGRMLTHKDVNLETVSDQYLKAPSLMAEPEFNEIRKKRSNNRVRLSRNAVFSWSYQQLP